MTAVQTVLGAIESAQLGTVLSHEHVVGTVGVAHDAIFRSGGIAAGAASAALRAEIPPMIYLPLAQSAGMRPPGLTSLDISIRSTRGAPVALAAAVGSVFAAVDPNLSLLTRPLDDYVDAVGLPSGGAVRMRDAMKRVPRSSAASAAGLLGTASRPAPGTMRVR